MGLADGLERVQRERNTSKGSPRFLVPGTHCHLCLPCHRAGQNIRSLFSLISACF